MSCAVVAAHSRSKPPSSESLTLPLEDGQPQEEAAPLKEKAENRETSEASQVPLQAAESAVPGHRVVSAVPLQDGAVRQGVGSSIAQVYAVSAVQLNNEFDSELPEG